MKQPWYSRINWLAIAIFIPVALQLWQDSPLSAQYPNLALWVALIGSLAIVAIRTFLTAEPTTLSTEATRERATARRRFKQKQTEADARFDETLARLAKQREKMDL